MESAGTSSVSTLANPEAGRIHLGSLDTKAITTADRQRLNKPWWCGKIELTVTNEKCRAFHARADYRACEQCSIPNILPKPKEGQGMAKGNCDCCDAKNVVIYRKGGVNRCYHCHKDEVEPTGLPGGKAVAHPMMATQGQPDTPSFEHIGGVAASEAVPATPTPPEATFAHPEPSWEDFEVMVERNLALETTTARITDKDLRLSGGAVALLPGFETGAYVEVGVSKDRTMVALKLASQDVKHARRLTSANRTKTRQVSISPVIRAYNMKAGTYQVEAAAWGLIVRLDKPLGEAR